MISFITTYWVQIYAFITLVMLFANFFLTKTFAKQTKVEELERRLARLEGEFKHLPSKTDISDLDRRIENQSGKLDTILTQLNHLHVMTQMLTENEIKG
ncbi:DUF2730 domain-containing protein [Motilimonas cestriensis]|uniref:DUF2730 domain-containing protein n=1 Tax=Motilimonas cestriensis TaxID=2742685 RepID=A0ABS8W821_9GAMM|nr:DUF2730 domain-containing protein [Motilimonas cestriensis]